MRSRGDSDARERQHSDHEPESKAVTSKGVVEITGDKRSETGTDRHKDSLRRDDGAVGSSTELFREYRRAQWRNGSKCAAKQDNEDDDPNGGVRIDERHNTDRLDRDAHRQEALLSNTFTEHVEHEASG
jgi:hypothetical protein